MADESIQYTQQHMYIGLALSHHAQAFDKLDQEMETFLPLPIERFDPLRNRLWSEMRPINDHLSDGQLLEFVEAQVAAAASINHQFANAFSDRFMIHAVPIMLLSHSLIEALVNASLAIGLQHIGKTDLFPLLEKSDIRTKLIVTPKAYCHSYIFPTGKFIYSDFTKLVKARNAWVHSKIEVSKSNGQILIAGSSNQRFDLGDDGRRLLKRFVDLPYGLHTILCEQITDATLKFRLETLLPLRRG